MIINRFDIRNLQSITPDSHHPRKCLRNYCISAWRTVSFRESGEAHRCIHIYVRFAEEIVIRETETQIERPREIPRGLQLSWLPKCASMRTRPGRVEPDVCFRIVHVAQNGNNGAPAAAYREQTVEIALGLGPKDAFKNSNIGVLKRRVATARVVSAAPSLRGNPKPPMEPRTPRVVGFLRKAIEWQKHLESGRIASQAEIARHEGITRARVTQVMGMLRLAPQIREQILSMPDGVHHSPVTERMLRPITAITTYHEQIREFRRSMR